MLTTLALAFLTSFPQPSFAQEKPAAAQTASLVAERRELAEIQLLLGADRKYTEAKERLATLKETLAKRTDADAKDLLAEVERLDQTVRRALGEAVPASMAGAGQDKVDQAVQAAIERGDYAFVQALGKRSVPALIAAVRADLDQLPSVDSDPLRQLLTIDPLAASQLAGELLGENGFFWKKRVVRILRGDLISNPVLWSAATPQRWLGTGLSKTAEKYVEDTDVGLAAFQFLLALEPRQVPSERLSSFAAILERALRSSDPERREAVKQWAKINADVVGLASFTALLDEPDEDLRAFAVGVLSRSFRDDRQALRLVDDPSPAVRRQVLEWLERVYSDEADWRAALARLLVDPMEYVREDAWRLLQKMTTVERKVPISAAESFAERDGTLSRVVFAAPLADDAYRSLLKGKERSSLCSIAPKLSASLCFELFQVLAEEHDADVIRNVNATVRDTPGWEDPPAALRVATTLLDNPTLADKGEVLRFAGGLSGTRTGLDAFARWALARADDQGLQELIRRKDRGVFHNLSLLDPQLVATCLARIYAVEPGTVAELIDRGGETYSVNASAREALVRSPELSRALRGLARDARQPLELRVLALRETLRKVQREDAPDEEQVGIALGLLEDPAWRSEEGARAATLQLDWVLRHHGEGLANPVILRAVRDPQLAEAVVAELADEFVASEAGAAEIVPLVLAHWPSALWTQPVVKALQAMRSVPALQDPAFLARAVHDAELAGFAFGTLQRLSDPRYLPLLAEVVAKPENDAQLAGAARALIGYLDEGAVEPLLAAAAKVQDADTRDACLAHLEKIREYLDAKERWATGKVKAQTREQVIAELVAQLAAKSDEVKVQAIRALATWDAVETMPRLIELTTSGSKSVAAAAREALERLNAPKKE